VTYLIEYLGKFEFIFGSVLGYVSGDQMGYFEGKKTESKISRLGTFKVGGVVCARMVPGCDPFLQEERYAHHGGLNSEQKMVNSKLVLTTNCGG
jgi:hypothetical protein